MSHEKQFAGVPQRTPRHPRYRCLGYSQASRPGPRICRIYAELYFLTSAIFHRSQARRTSAMGLADVPTGAGIHKPLSLTHSRPNAALRELVKNSEFVGNGQNATRFEVRVWTLAEFRRELKLPDHDFATVRRLHMPPSAAKRAAAEPFLAERNQHVND